MTLKKGHRVTFRTPDVTHPHHRHDGKVGEVDEVGTKDNGHDGEVLVDSQLKGGVREGRQDVREWVKVADLELG